MGTDIHGIWQARDAAGNWMDIPSNYAQDRHYQLFAALAGVRNGVGFAGTRTGDSITPIAQPRGYPEDFAVNADDEHPITDRSTLPAWRRAHMEPDETTYWMGDHSHSWLTGAEMLAWYANAPVVMHCGVLSREEYAGWDRQSEPEAYCGGIVGPRIVVIEDTPEAKAATPKWTHITVSWKQSLAEELGYFFDEVQRLMARFGEDIRFVFGFDS